MRSIVTSYHRDYDLGNWLEMLRNRACLTQEELSRLVGVSTTTVRKWESGGTAPKATNLKKLIGVYRGRGIFTSGKEREEAAELWEKAKLNAAFDEAWFKLISDQSPAPATATPLQVRTERAGPRHNLPQRSYLKFVGRQEKLQKLTGQLMLSYPRSRHFLVTVDGIGGVGKSALAIELAYYYLDNYASLPPEKRFERIVWVSAKRTFLTARGIQSRPQSFNTVFDLYREIATVLEQPAILQAHLEHQRSLVERALSSERTLLIVDNLETVDDEELLGVEGRYGQKNTCLTSA